MTKRTEALWNRDLVLEQDAEAYYVHCRGKGLRHREAMKHVVEFVRVETRREIARRHLAKKVG